MQHLGDITKLSGYDLPPVDVISGGSPCFPAGTLVLTDEGYIEIENVKVGMKVLTHKGRWRSVISVGSTCGETVILKGNHYGLECTLNHPIYSTNTHRYYPQLGNGKRGERVLLNNEREWIPASEMQGRLWAVPRVIEALPIDLTPYHTEDKHCNPMPEFNEDFFYFVGRWLGDGWVRANQRTGRPKGQCWGQIVMCDGFDKEDELKETVKRIADSYNIEHCKTAVKIKFVSKMLCKWLTDNFGQYSYGKQLPSWIYGMNTKWREALLKGLMDSDGHYVKKAKSKTGRITTTSKRLAEGLRLLLEIQGFSTTIFREIPSKTKNIEGRTVNQRTYYIVQFCDRNECTRVHFEDEWHSWYRVRSVTKTNETKMVYNLTVDEDNSYVADGIVVHNCQDLSTAGKRKGLAGERSGLFLEQIRLIKEMRDATNGKQPRYMVWENVFGTFSSNKGEDFRCVLEETAKIADKDAVIPGPPKGKWVPAGLIVGDGWSIAWRVHDAQFWGVPQRRKRICLLADFSGDTAGKILFELRREALGGKTKQVVGDIGGESGSEIRPVGEGLSRDTQEGRKEGQSAAADAGTGFEETGRVASTITATYGTKWNGNAGAYNGGNFVIQERRT